MPYPLTTIQPPYILYIFINNKVEQPRSSTEHPVLSLKNYSSTEMISLPDQGLKEPLWVYGIYKRAPSPTQMCYIMRKQWKLCLRVQASWY